MAAVDSSTVSQHMGVNGSVATVENLFSKNVVYATIDKTPRARLRKKKAIKAPPRRKKKLTDSNCDSILHKLASGSTTIATANDQKSRRPVLSCPLRNRRKPPTDVHLLTNLHQEHDCSTNVNLHRPFLPQKSGTKTSVSLPQKVEEPHNGLTKLEILKQHWQKTSFTKEADFQNELLTEEDDLSKYYSPEVESPSKLDCEQNSIYYSSGCSQSPNNVSDYATLCSEVTLNSDLQSDRDSQGSCDTECYMSSFSISEASEDFDDLATDLSTFEKPHRVNDFDYKLSDISKEFNNVTDDHSRKSKNQDGEGRSSSSISDVTHDFDNLIEEISALGKYCITNSCIDIEFDDLITILDIPNVSSMQANDPGLKTKSESIFQSVLNKAEREESVIQYNKFTINISESQSVGDGSIQSSSVNSNVCERDKELHIIDDSSTISDTPDSNSQSSELPLTKAKEATINCTNFKGSKDLFTVQNSVNSVHSNGFDKQLLGPLHALSLQDPFEYYSSSSDDAEPSILDEDPSVLDEDASILDEDPSIFDEDPSIFDENLRSAGTDNLNSNVTWKVSELWDTLNNKLTMDENTLKIEYVKHMSNGNAEKGEYTNLISSKNHSDTSEFEANSKSGSLEKGTKVIQNEKIEKPKLTTLCLKTCIEESKQNSLPENKYQAADPIQVNVLNSKDFLIREKERLEPSQNFSDREKQTQPPSEQIFQNSSSDISLNSAAEKWQFARQSNSRGTSANSVLNPVSSLDVSQRSSCCFDEFRKTEMGTNGKNPSLTYSGSLHPHRENVFRMEQMMPPSSANLFKTNKAPRQLMKPFLVHLCIEGHSLHLEPFLYEIYPTMTLLMLKMKVNSELSIKTSLQRWILGNVFADNDDATLLSYGVAPGSYIFLYVDSYSKDTNHSSSKVERKVTKGAADVEHQSPVFGQLAPLTMKAGLLEMMTQEKVKSGAGSPLRETQHNGSPVTKRSVISGDSLLSLRSRIKNKQATAITKPPDPASTPVNPVLSERKKVLHPDTTSKCKNSLPTLTEEEKQFVSFLKADRPLHEELPRGILERRCAAFSPSRRKECFQNQENNGVAVDSKTRKDLGKPEVEEKGIVSLVNPSLNNTESQFTSHLDIAECKTIERKPMKSNINDGKDLLNTRQNYERFLELENLDLVPNSDAFECPICLCVIPENQGAILRDCLHSFCRDCLSSVIVHSSKSSIECPYLDNTYSCNMHLQQREIKAIVSVEVYEQYLQRSLTAAESIAEKSFHCRTPDCPGWCLIEDKINIFHCPVCSHYNCLTCQAIHERFNCRQYQDNLKRQAVTDKDAEETLQLLAKMVREGKAMKCPKCCVVLMKKWGCDWLKCSVCQTEVCWITKGPRWGPEGRGDISAGCKCGVEGKKCHPSCTYCH